MVNGWEEYDGEEEFGLGEEEYISNSRLGNLERLRLSNLIVNIAENKKDISELYKETGLTEAELDKVVDLPESEYKKLFDKKDQTPRKIINDAMDVFKEEHKKISSSKQQAKRAAELTGIAVGKVCLKIVAAASLVLGNIVFAAGKAAKFGSLGIVNKIPGLSRDVEFSEEHHKGTIALGNASDGITSPRGRVNRLEVLGFNIARAGLKVSHISKQEWSPSPSKKAKESAVDKILNAKNRSGSSWRAL